MDYPHYYQVKKIVRDLSESIGFKKNVTMSHIRSPRLGNNRMSAITTCMTDIAESLGLPILIKATLVSDKDHYNIFGRKSVAAQVRIPGNLPSYGSLALKGYPIEVKLSQDCTKRRSSFVATVAHELSHIVLHSLRHPDKDSEFHTDICAMLYGYQNIMEKGRKYVESCTRSSLFGSTTTTNTTTYGYLTDQHFRWAFREINEIRKEYRSYCSDISYNLIILAGLIDKYSDNYDMLMDITKHLISKKCIIALNDSKTIVEIYGNAFNDTVANNISKGRHGLNGLKDAFVKIESDDIMFINKAINVLNRVKADIDHFKCHYVDIDIYLDTTLKYLSVVERLKFYFRLRLRKHNIYKLVFVNIIMRLIRRLKY